MRDVGPAAGGSLVRGWLGHPLGDAAGWGGGRIVYPFPASAASSEKREY